MTVLIVESMQSSFDKTFVSACSTLDTKFDMFKKGRILSTAAELASILYQWLIYKLYKSYFDNWSVENVIRCNPYGVIAIAIKIMAILVIYQDVES